MILTAIESQIDLTLVELAEMLRAEHGAQFAPSTIWRFLDRHSMTLEKAARASEQDRPDLLARRRAWFKVQPDIDPEKPVFINETSDLTKMDLLRGHVAHDWLDRADGPRWADDRGMVGRMCAAGPRADIEARYDIVILDNLPARRLLQRSRPSKPSLQGCPSFRPTALTSIQSQMHPQS